MLNTSLTSSSGGAGSRRRIPSLINNNSNNTKNNSKSKHIRICLARYYWLISYSVAGCLLCCLFVPLFILTSITDPDHHPNAVQGVHQLVRMAKRIQHMGETTPVAVSMRNNVPHNNNNQNKGGAIGQPITSIVNRRGDQVTSPFEKKAMEPAPPHDQKDGSYTLRVKVKAETQALQQQQPPPLLENSIQAAAGKAAIQNAHTAASTAHQQQHQDNQDAKIGESGKNKENPAAVVAENPARSNSNNNNNNNNGFHDNDAIQPPTLLSLAEQQVKPHFSLSDLKSFGDGHEGWIHKPVARGVAGRPLAETPALVGAQRGHIAHCDMNVDSMAYWNDPVGTRDQAFQSPFMYRSSSSSSDSQPQEEQFITFSSDLGGWNNVRMSMEILFVLAAVTNRTLVLPPKEPIYLLDRDKRAEHRGFRDFFPLQNPRFPIKLMSMEDFLTKNPKQQQFLSQKQTNISDHILDVAKVCDKRRLSENFCGVLYDYLDEVGHNPKIHDFTTCLIFDVEASKGNPPSPEAQKVVETYCGPERTVMYWNNQDHGRHNHLHLPAYKMDDRLLAHFYNLMYFSDPAVGHYAKRFVRDFLHYNDAIYCAAGKIVKAIQAEAIQRGFALDSEKGGGYSSMHVRRGDLQFKEVKISGEEWYNNTKEAWLDNEILYIATDERNKTFFDELARHHELRFLDDYWDLADLSSLDPNYIGMIDTIVASRGRAFAGTWFSTFTGYIIRLRGYYGFSMKNTWYSYLLRKTALHEWPIIARHAYAFEWPDGWAGIDSDAFPAMDVF